MKKITLIAALLGSAYFANAQVGIGTPTPNASAMLDITATNKGVLIPRVALTANDDQTTVTTPTTSLLVYNTNTSDANVADVKKVTPGFYYWNVNKWERIVNQSQLDTAITNVTNLQGDVTKIKALLDAAYGSNNLGDTATSDSFGGMVFTPAVGNPGDADYEAPKFEYVKWNATSNSYERLDITSVITDLINASETKTKIVTIEDVQYYVSESYTGTTDPTDGNEPGVYKIDVVGGVVNNFSEIINSNTTIEGTNQTIKQYFEELGATDSNTVYFNNSSTAITVGNVSVPAYTFYIKDASGNAIEIDLADLIAKLEAVTTLVKSNGALADPITYTYSNEDVINEVQGATPTVIEITADMVTSITYNTDVQNAISNVLNQGGNVYYGDHDNSASTSNVFYTINTNGDKVVITIPVDIDQLITSINNTTVEKKNELKLALGDKITTNNTSVFTGDSITIDGVVHYIYKGNFTTTVTANSAVTTGVTLDKTAEKILSLDLRYNGGMVANVTTMTLNGTALGFNIGTGNMYQVLGTADIVANVIIEFASTAVPAGVNP